MTTFELPDQLIERALRSRTSAGADELLVQSILREVGSLRQVRRPWFDPGLGLRRTRWVLAAAATLIVVLAALLVLGGGHSPFSVPSSFQPPPAPSASGPSPAATAVATGRLVFIRGGDVVMLDLGSGTEHVITHVDGAYEPTWAPDGGAVAFLAGGISVVGTGAGQAIRVNVDGTGRLVRPLGLRVRRDAWSPNARLLADYSKGTSPADVEVEDIPSGRFMSYTFFRPDEGMATSTAVSWSPTADAFAVVGCMPASGCDGSVPSTSLATLWSVPFAGGEAVRLAQSSQPLSVAGWMSDGSTIAFGVDPCDGTVECTTGSEISIVPAGGGTAERRFLPNDRPVGTLQWSRDDSLVAFASARDGTTRVYVADGDGGSPRVIGDGRDPVWSPDGRWLAFIGNDADASLWIAPVDGSSPPDQISPTSAGVDWWQPGLSAP